MVVKWFVIDISILGNSEWNFSINGSKKYFVTVVLAPILIVPVSKFLREVNFLSPFLKLSIPFFINSKNILPFSVKVTPFGVLLKRVISRVSSNFFIHFVIAGWEIYNEFAAFVMLPINCYGIKNLIIIITNIHT